MKHFYYQLIATFSFFTRLPFWRLAQVPKEYYENIVPFWPLVGWLTGGIVALTCLATSALPMHISVIVGLIIRCLMTGALHEDGFADFCDGFGGGYTRERILEIMKDSHIGTYGVLGLLLYLALQISTMTSVLSSINNGWTLFFLVVSVDSISKFLSSTIIYFLPYARNEQTSKNKLVYKPAHFRDLFVSFLPALLPVLLIAILGESICLVYHIGCAAILAMVCTGFLFMFMKSKIQGYTGDCCGASFIITEAVFYIVLAL